MQGERVLVTGGSGFIGSNLAEVLEKGSDVIILDDMSTGKQVIDANLKQMKTSAIGLKAKRPMFSALVSARKEEYGRGFFTQKEAAPGSA